MYHRLDASAAFLIQIQEDTAVPTLSTVQKPQPNLRMRSNEKDS